MPAPGPGQMLLRTLYLSLDPYMRGRMSAGPSYVAATEIGQHVNRWLLALDDDFGFHSTCPCDGHAGNSCIWKMPSGRSGSTAGSLLMERSPAVAL